MNRFVIVDGLPYLYAAGKTYAVRWDSEGFTVGTEVELTSVPAVTLSELSVKAKCERLDSIVQIEEETEEERTPALDEMTLAELKALDFSAGHSAWQGIRIPTFEEILQKFAGRVIMNIHVKIWDAAFENPMIEEIVALVRKYDCEKHIYFMTTNDEIIKQVMEYAPDLKICVGWNGNKDPMSIVDRAIELGAYKVQLFKPYFNQEMIDKAHANGIICNVFWSDDPEEAKQFLNMGIDTILTNDYNLVAQAVKNP